LSPEVLETDMKRQTLHDLFVDQLRDAYDAEKQLVKALPKMAKAARSPDLRQGFEKHLQETQHQVERLEQVFEEAGHKAKGKTCEAMKGLVEEGKDIIDMKAEPEVRDAGLIAAAQKVEHYEIASYGCLCTWAEQLGYEKAHRLLGETLDEEKQTDAKLTELAKAHVNREVGGGEGEADHFGDPESKERRHEVEAHADAAAAPV
jgi:ferritin-like metal-binding protein YciE